MYNIGRMYAQVLPQNMILKTLVHGYSHNAVRNVVVGHKSIHSERVFKILLHAVTVVHVILPVHTLSNFICIPRVDVFHITVAKLARTLYYKMFAYLPDFVVLFLSFCCSHFRPYPLMLLHYELFYTSRHYVTLVIPESHGIAPLSMW